MTWLINPETKCWITPTDTVAQWIEYCEGFGKVTVVEHSETVTEVIYPYDNGTDSVWLETVE